MAGEKGPSPEKPKPDPITEAAKKALPYLAAISLSGDAVPPAYAQREEITPTAVERLLQERLHERGAHPGDKEYSVSPQALAIVDVINALPESQTTLPEPLRAAIRAESFDVAKLIGRYAARPVAQDVVRTIFDTNPANLLQDIEYLETLPWGKTIIEQLFLALPKSGMDYGLFFHPAIQTSDDPSVQILKNLFEAAEKRGGDALASKTVLLTDDVVMGTLSIDAALTIANSEDSTEYEKRLQTIADRNNALGIFDVKEEIGLREQSE